VIGVILVAVPTTSTVVPFLLAVATAGSAITGLMVGSAFLLDRRKTRKVAAAAKDAATTAAEQAAEAAKISAEVRKIVGAMQKTGEESHALLGKVDEAVNHREPGEPSMSEDVAALAQGKVSPRKGSKKKAAPTSGKGLRQMLEEMLDTLNHKNGG
jgi:hypothetical protein